MSRLLLTELCRRDMMIRVARRAFGVSLLPLLGNLARAAEQQGAKSGSGKAKHMIYIRLTGAMSHVDTLDPKPGNAVMGETTAIDTKLPGVKFGEFLPQLAGLADQIAVVRSMNTSTGDHSGASYLQQTSYRKIASIRHPGLGSWAQRMLGNSHASLPSTVQIGNGGGPGYLGSKFAPVPVGDPDAGLENTTAPEYLTDQAFDKRIALSQSFDAAFRKLAQGNSHVSGYDDLYRDAISLLRSEDLAAFDLAQESDKIKAAYGSSRVGRGALLARRLIQRGVRCVEVAFGSFDHHYDLWESLPDQARALDQAVAALLSDLKSTGLLSETVVAVSAEFGRKPHINQRAGRDHHPAAYSAILAGAGIKTGQVYGKSDDEAFYVEDDGVDPAKFNATIARCLGIDPREEITAPNGRPFTLGNGEDAVAKLLA